jgi:rubrerythrin
MQENNSLIPDINGLVACALKSENDFIANLQTYYRMPGHETAARFLLSLLEQAREHIRSLQELRQEGNLEALPRQQTADAGPEFSQPPAAAAAGLDATNSSPADFLDFLTLCIEHKEQTIKLYKYLAAQMSNQDAAFLFQRLADEEQKQKNMLLDRHELEILCRDRQGTL